MIPDDLNVHTDNSPEDFTVFDKMKVPYNKDKSEVWAELKEQISPPVKTFWLSPIKILAAASLLIFISAGLFCKFYTEIIFCEKGGHIDFNLPDGSVVALNSDSRLSYAPYWWYINRSVVLDGEAFFEVEKGSKFTVVSTQGSTVVLGTSFNVRARDERYEVTCISGKVKVSTVATEKEMILVANQKALIKGENLVMFEQMDVENETAWRNFQFFFDARPLDFVIDEMERQYDVTIQCDFKLNYSGSFSKEIDLEDALDLICLPFNLIFVKTADRNYKITDNN
jgi:transmembrane sensor